MKKRVSLIVTAIALAAMMVVGGTLAWFTDTKSVTNAATFGKGQIELREVFSRNDTYAKTGDITANGDQVVPNGTKFELTNFVPGDKLTKTPVVKNSGSIPMLVRATITYKGKVFGLENGISVSNMEALFPKTSDWQYATSKFDNKTGEGTIVVYKLTDLNADDSSTIFDLTKTFDATLCGNEFQNADASIAVKVEAIQSENSGLTKTNEKYDLNELVTFFTGKDFHEVTK